MGLWVWILGCEGKGVEEEEGKGGWLGGGVGIYFDDIRKLLKCFKWIFK